MTALSQIGVALLFTAVLLPLMFWFGAEKGRMILLLVIGVPFLFLLLWLQMGYRIDERMVQQLVDWLPIAGIAALGISVKISLQLYKRKEIQ